MQLFVVQGSSLNAVLFDAWVQCEEGNWDKSKFYMDIKTRHSSRRRGVRKWLLRHEMVEKFTEPVAQAMIDHKLADEKLLEKETRYHPNLPPKEAEKREGRVGLCCWVGGLSVCDSFVFGVVSVKCTCVNLVESRT